MSNAGVTTVGEFEFAPEERPTFPGSPFNPVHPLKLRLAFGAVGACTGMASTFGNALTNVNVNNLAGPLGLYVALASWLPAIYVAMNATANLTLVKARIQFGVPRVTHGLLIAYMLIGLLQLPVLQRIRGSFDIAQLIHVLVILAIKSDNYRAQLKRLFG